MDLNRSPGAVLSHENFLRRRSLARIDGRPFLRYPLRDPSGHVEDVPVAELSVQSMAHHTAAPAAVANEREGVVPSRDGGELRKPCAGIVAAIRIEEREQVASFDDTGLAPFLGSANVDDGHPSLHEPLERGAVDPGDVGAKRCAACEQGGDEEKQSRHCEIRHE